MVLLGDEAQVVTPFGAFGDSVILTQDRSTVCVERTIRSEIVLDTLNSKVTWVIWNIASFRLETVLVSGQDRCMVRARHTTGLEIVLDAPDGTTR